MGEAATKLEQRKSEAAPAPAPRRWEPFESLRHEVDRLFEGFADAMGRRAPARPAFEMETRWPSLLGWDAIPQVDIAETDAAYEMTAELPGLTEKDFELTVADGMLVLRGEKRQQSATDKADVMVSERRYGAFQRSFRLPPSVEHARIEARFEKGVLTVRLPKSESARSAARRIAVKAA